MKVLLNSLFHPELVRGGAQQICYELFEGLKARPDIEPILLAAIEPRFAALYKTGARITGFDNRPNEYVFLNRDFDFAWNKATSPPLVEAYAQFLETIQPDVVHFHHFLLFGINLLPLTRRVLPRAKIIFTFHEFLAICAADGQMLRHSDKSLCTRSSNVRCHQCFPDRGPEQFFLREMWMKRHLAAVDRFTAPSRFMIEHYVDWGLDRARIDHVTNGQRDYSGGVALTDDRKRRNRFGFFGQMVDNKGIWVILRAVEQLRSEGFDDFTIEINGDNLRYASQARRTEIEEFRAAEAKLPFAEQKVVFNGSYHVDELAPRMARIDWCIVPSTWWEIFGLVISESWMFKRPVIASDVGGPRERVRHNEDGLLFAVADAKALADTIRRACTEEGLWERLVAGIRPPAGRDVMVDGYLATYEVAEPPEAPPDIAEPEEPTVWAPVWAPTPTPRPLATAARPVAESVAVRPADGQADLAEPVPVTPRPVTPEPPPEPATPAPSGRRTAGRRRN